MRAFVVFVGASASAGLTACSDTNAGGAPVVSSQELTIPLAFSDTGGNAGPRISVTLPSAPPISMVFDTGSAGLRILPNAMAEIPAADYTDTGTPIASEFGMDRVYYGTLGTMNPGVRLGGIAVIAKAFPFEIVKIVCDGNVPSPVPNVPPSDCVDGTAAEEHSAIDGTFGVRPQLLSSGIVNPLAELPPPYGNGFIVSAYGPSPSVTVGATASNSAGFGLYDVPAATAPDGSAYWNSNDLLPWCYSFAVPGSAATPPVCPATGVLTDSGGENERLNLPGLPPPGVAPQTIETLPPATVVTATLTQSGTTSPAITWTLTTGTCTYFDAPLVYFAGSGPSATGLNTSNALEPFFTNDVLYDLQGGAFGFRPVTPGPPASCG